METLPANLIAVLHGAGIAFVIFAIGACIAGRLQLEHWRLARWLLWGWLAGKLVGYWITGGCILTVWEQQLRQAAGTPNYTGGYITHYLSFVGIHLSDAFIRDVAAWPVLAALYAQLYWTWRRKWRKVLYG